MPSLRHLAIRAIQESDPLIKVGLTNKLLADELPIGNESIIEEPEGLPGRPVQPVLAALIANNR